MLYLALYMACDCNRDIPVNHHMNKYRLQCGSWQCIICSNLEQEIKTNGKMVHNYDCQWLDRQQLNEYWILFVIKSFWLSAIKLFCNSLTFSPSVVLSNRTTTKLIFILLLLTSYDTEFEFKKDLLMLTNPLLTLPDIWNWPWMIS